MKPFVANYKIVQLLANRFSVTTLLYYGIYKYITETYCIMGKCATSNFQVMEDTNSVFLLHPCVWMKSLLAMYAALSLSSP